MIDRYTETIELAANDNRSTKEKIAEIDAESDRVNLICDRILFVCGGFLVGLLTIALFTGCVSVPESFGIQAYDYQRPFQSEAEEIVKGTLINRFDMDIEDATADIYWSNEICPNRPNPDAPEVTAVVYRDECYHGIMFGCDAIFVADRGCIGASAYAHELAHCYLMWGKTVYDGDGAHENTEYWEAVGDIDLNLQLTEGCEQ